MDFKEFIGKDAEKVKLELKKRGFKVSFKDNNSFNKQFDHNLVVKVNKVSKTEIVLITNKFLLNI